MIQRKPVMVQAGISPRGQAFASRIADTVVATARDVPTMKAFTENLRRLVAENGRDPESIKVLFLIEPVLGETDADAAAAAERIQQYYETNYDWGLSTLSGITMLDLSKYDLDAPLPSGLKTNGHQGQLDDMIASGVHVRNLDPSGSSREANFIGSPATVADRMEEMVERTGADGFLITKPALTRRFVTELVDGLAPELQSRGLMQDGYAGRTFRENMLAF